MLLKDIRQIFREELAPIYSREEVNSIFSILIEHYLHLERFVLALQPGLQISKEQEQPFFEALTSLKQQIPIQYIIGETTFMDMVFEVNPQVLIPRPETEELVRWIIAEHDNTHLDPGQEFNILDIGTGSGCIAISLAKYIKGVSVDAIDLSDEIIGVAKANAKRNKVEVQFLQKDIFEVNELARTYDLIVSNPPYVRESEKLQMERNVLDYEPEKALFVNDATPLVYFKKIAELAVNSLKDKGLLFLEINQYLGQETYELLDRSGFKAIELRKDFLGNERMIKATYFVN